MSKTTPLGPALPVDGLSAPGGHYTHVRTGSGLVFISGQLPIDESGKACSHLDPTSQTRLALKNAETALASMGCNWNDVLKVTAYLAGVEHWPMFDTVYASILGEARPTRSVVPVPGLHYGLLVEIEVIALKP